MTHKVQVLSRRFRVFHRLEKGCGISSKIPPYSDVDDCVTENSARAKAVTGLLDSYPQLKKPDVALTSVHRLYGKWITLEIVKSLTLMSAEERQAFLELVKTLIKGEKGLVESDAARRYGSWTAAQVSESISLMSEEDKVAFARMINIPVKE